MQARRHCGGNFGGASIAVRDGEARRCNTASATRSINRQREVRVSARQPPVKQILNGLRSSKVNVWSDWSGQQWSGRRGKRSSANKQETSGEHIRQRKNSRFCVENPPQGTEPWPHARKARILVVSNRRRIHYIKHLCPIQSAELD